MIPGPLLFARYAFKPNALGYCGGSDNLALFQYTTESTVDRGLLELEQQFEGAYPYLQLIARANQIADPLDARVVEAYWIGNELLDRVDMGLLFQSITQRFEAKMPPKEWHWLKSKIPAGARPHHSFHVFEVYPRAGFMKSGAVDHLFETMEQCRIRWGQVEDVLPRDLVVTTSALEWKNGKIVLGIPKQERIQRAIDGRGFVDDASPGDWVSIHWGWACDRLDTRQVANLRRYTEWQLQLLNTTV